MSTKVLAIGKDRLYAVESSLEQQPALVSYKIHTQDGVVTLDERNAYTEDTNSTAAKSKVIKSIATRKNGFNIEYFALLPDDSVRGGSPAPLVMYVHGGPHSAFRMEYSAIMSFLVSLGYAVAVPNYRGSIGYGQEFIDTLPGNCGTFEVEDVQLVMEDLWEKNPGVLSKKNIGVMGGSHGGFTATQLTGQDPRFKVAVVRNPVINIASLAGVTDIPDWSYTEVTGKSKTQLTGDVFKKMLEMSPIVHVDKVKAPTLLLLSAGDKRVPPSQGKQYYYALKERGVKTEMIMYPDEYHAITQPEHYADFCIKHAVWFKRYLK